MNLTNLTQGAPSGQGQHPGQGQYLPPQFTVVSPQNDFGYNPHNMTNDAGNSSIGGPNPFATQAMIGLHQIPSS
jgi:hypothetical protein